MSNLRRIKKLAIGAGAGLFASMLVLTINASATDETKVTICHMSPCKPYQYEMKVPPNQLGDHFSHGDYLGPCNPDGPGIPF